MRFSLAEPPASASRSWALTARERCMGSMGSTGARLKGWDGRGEGQRQGQSVGHFWSSVDKGSEGSVNTLSPS
jgi:hypothetical protein